MSGEDEIVTDEERELFDRILDRIVASLPAHLRAKLEEVPLIVEDYPSDTLLDELDEDDPGALCGLHTGIPLTERSVEHDGTPGDVIHVFREGVLRLSTDEEGFLDERELEKQIRITLLHEMGHHFGLDEEDLEKLGYG